MAALMQIKIWEEQLVYSQEQSRHRCQQWMWGKEKRGLEAFQGPYNQLGISLNEAIGHLHLGCGVERVQN